MVDIHNLYFKVGTGVKDKMYIKHLNNN